LASEPGDRAGVEASRVERHVQRRIEGEHRRPAGRDVDALQCVRQRRHASEQHTGLRRRRSDDDGIEALGMVLLGQLQLPLTGVPAQRAYGGAQADIQRVSERPDQRTHAGGADPPGMRGLYGMRWQVRRPRGGRASALQAIQPIYKGRITSRHELRAVIVDIAAVGAARGKTPTDAAALLEDHRRQALLVQLVCAGEAGHASAEDGDAGRCAVRHARGSEDDERVWHRGAPGRNAA
jgi:hypothetical protein